ncbi:hypothetical protein KJA14_02615 [Patescibacteria group bacterium]|nr:hypothetical protein [Patescibacteria group bacterium]
MLKNYLILRKKYPRFVFEKYSWKISNRNLNIFFDFKIPPQSENTSRTIRFRPEVVIKNVNKNQIKRIGDRALNNLVFHLGLIEILSYWKATCSPEIKILAGSLNKEQIKWWKDLIVKGMGQFFYENKIDFRTTDFLKITTPQRTVLCGHNRARSVLARLKNRILVPIGGGKDSIVTLEILKAKKNITCFSLNSTEASRKIMEIGCQKPIIVRREIDKKLLELNQKGFLNGHTPFSAYLAFLTVLCAVLFDFKYIAFSNERSSNEGNLKYLGKIINHQYSKSFDFEERFRKYSKRYLAKNVEYFSFLRPLYEIQISKLFSRYAKYFSSFISCNEAFKTYSGRKKILKKWCQKCPKCLFVFATLYPFLGEKKLVKIFGQNIFKKKELLPIMLELMGLRKFKPFECVGTKKESLVAFYLSFKKLREQFSRDCRPFLLKYFEKNILPKYPNLEKESKKIMNSWNNQYNLPGDSEKILKRAIFS